MSHLLTDEERPLHRAQPGDSLSTVVRARTLTVLSRLDSGRKRSVLEFLYESRLIEREQALLNQSDLIERRPNIVNLQRADLSFANLVWAGLISANLHGADLSGADLRGVILTEANLRKADLSGANLAHAKGVTNEELERQAKSLDGAVLPNGQKYEDWYKDR